MNRKKLGAFERVLLITALVLSSILLLLLAIGIIVAMIRKLRKNSLSVTVTQAETGAKPAQTRTAAGTNSSSFGQLLAQAIALHNEGMEGSLSAIREAHRAFERLRKENPGHTLANAYHGSTMVLMAREEVNRSEKLSWALQGLGLLDKSVADAPRDARIRLLRGSVAYRLTEPSHDRTETAIEDYLVVLDAEHREPGSLDAKTYAKLIAELGEAYRRMERPKEAEMCRSRLLAHKREYRRSGSGEKNA